MKRIKIWWFIKCFFGFGSVVDGSICWFSKQFWDIHDYPTKKGGNGFPLHFYKYKCTECNKEFEI